MIIRRAEIRDIDRILKLLSQVLEIHAKIRPDIFISCTTKYTREQLTDIISDDTRPIFVADNGDKVVGYAFCVIRRAAFETTMKPRKTLYIDDLCVDDCARGFGVGKTLFNYVKEFAAKNGFDDVTLAVWQGNDSARAFYEKMGMTPQETIMELKI